VKSEYGGDFADSQIEQGGTDLRTIVREYILAKGNREAAEILEDYVEYLHGLGYVIRRQRGFKQRTNAHNGHIKRHSSHL